MFNPEKLLGGLLRGGLGGGRGLGAKGAVGLGILGVALEAADHFMNQPQGAGKSVVPPATLPGTPLTQEAPPLPPGRDAPSGPPPPPLAAGKALGREPSDSKEQGPAGPVRETGGAVLLIRSMIAAANADGVIDVQERTRILERLESVGLDQEERVFVVDELLAPAELDVIARQALSLDMGEQVYAVSLAAVTVDTAEEQAYLKTLAEALGLDTTAVDRIHKQWDM